MTLKKQQNCGGGDFTFDIADFSFGDDGFSLGGAAFILDING